MRISLSLLLLFGMSAVAQNYDPPPPKTPDAATLKLIEERTAKLKEAVAAALPKIREIHQADLEVYVKAAEWIVRHQEWYTADSGKQTLAVIEQGIKRAESAMDGKTPWLEPKGQAVARGYKSNVDGSIQPYGVVFPVGYGTDKSKKWRLDILLHGRDSSITEMKHLAQHAGRAAPKDQDFVQINIFGRGNNAYRWAGETDVFEAMEHFIDAEAELGRKDIIDLRRVVLKGFSMGGAGTWHIGLRHPDRFAVMQPGAGFTNTHGYIAKLPDTLPDYQEKCLRIYDAYRYAENAFNVPIVAYSGEIDAQRQAAENIQEELKRLGLGDHMQHLIGPKLAHSFPVEWQKNVEVELKKFASEGKGRAVFPERVRFVTYTPENGQCDWAEIRAFERQYEAARIDGKWDGKTFDVNTMNVRRLRLYADRKKGLPDKVTIDGKAIAAKFNSRYSRECEFVKREGLWSMVVHADLDREVLGKIGARSGPIDDAFRSDFLCVVGTGKPNHPAMHDAAIAQLDRFRREWDKYMRGILQVKKDTEVTDADRKSTNLILFGDAGSNKLIAEALKTLPIRWTDSTLDYGGETFDAASHLPILIQPSPFRKDRYIVLNSGHTFHEADFKGTNALLYPRLGDYAVVKPTPTAKDPAAFEVITAGLFDENWQIPKK